ncbi:MAG: aromatic ring-hydroxylating dioxygenase subunit alpha [Xanthomonadales bacterium]|nr:aromatic ring-hydroxylating dioxygenase subunit alpha [Xanthomonadales bacterium]
MLHEDWIRPQPLTSARALAPELYCLPEMRAIDQAAVFRRAWHLVGHVKQIPNPGDHRVVETAIAPLIVLRDGDGQLRAFHNVCRHRAGPLALCDGTGAKALRCRYHGWTYTLEGALRSAPEMNPLAEHGLEGTRLHECRLAVWEGLIFVAEAEASDFADYSRGWNAPLRALSPADYVFHRAVHYDIDCHWKVYCDNYLEGYHVPHIHPGLNSVLDYGDGDAVYYFLYPNAMLNLLPGRLQVNRVIPLGVERCRVYFEYYYADDPTPAGEARREADHAFAHQVQVEDIDICVQVQRGLSSGSYQPGRLNPLRENALHHFHELLRRAYRTYRTIR